MTPIDVIAVDLCKNCFDYGLVISTDRLVNAHLAHSAAYSDPVSRNLVERAKVGLPKDLNVIVIGHDTVSSGIMASTVLRPAWLNCPAGPSATQGTSKDGRRN